MAETNHMYRERVRREVEEQYLKQHQSAVEPRQRREEHAILSQDMWA